MKCLLLYGFLKTILLGIILINRQKFTSLSDRLAKDFESTFTSLFCIEY